MSGRRLADRLRARMPSARVLFVSGLTEQEVVRQGLVEAEALLLEKPFSAERLVRKVREIFDAPR